VAALQFIINALVAGDYTVVNAINALDELGYQYLGVPTDASVIAYIQSLIAGGANPVASAVAPVPVVVEGTGTGSCATKSGNRGICCAAVSQLGVQRASQGFQYTNCAGKVVCLACGTKQSISAKHRGQTVFAVKRISCGPSGCPALAGAQVPVPPL
jgi:hypothetical protein